MSLFAVVIGRNEGPRLVECLESLGTDFEGVIYVDSGSTDGSVAAARARGAEVIALDPAEPFTAARARNAGLAALPEGAELVQLIDGDCALRAGWIGAARGFLADHPEVALVCGRRRERHPDTSVYNQLIDREWDTPVGPARACGGDALARVAALRAVGGFDASLIAGEEPELCLRLRAAGWQIHRLGEEMTWHDARLLRFSQWWQRARRAGHAFAEGAARHGQGPERHWLAERRRALLWGALLPLLILLAALVLGPWALLVFLIYPLQVLRLARRGGLAWGFFTTLGRFPEAQGALGYLLRRAPRRIIEYR
jgi:GT2 family glycosyltransferase